MAYAINRTVFFDTLRPEVNLTTQNVAGTEKLLAYAEAQQTPIGDLAYILPTAWWESAQTMHPVKEAYWLSETWRANNLRYFPFYGRGLIQTTWEDNYRKLAVLLGLPSETFVDNPDLLLEWEHALPALFVGMQEGIYTGRDLDDYIDDIDESDDEDFREFVNARRIVNGTDKAEAIGRLALAFEKALRAAVVSPPNADDPGPEPEVPEETTETSPESGNGKSADVGGAGALVVAGAFLWDSAAWAGIACVSAAVLYLGFKFWLLPKLRQGR